MLILNFRICARKYVFRIGVAYAPDILIFGGQLKFDRFKLSFTAKTILAHATKTNFKEWTFSSQKIYVYAKKKKKNDKKKSQTLMDNN